MYHSSQECSQEHGSSTVHHCSALPKPETQRLNTKITHQHTKIVSMSFITIIATTFAFLSPCNAFVPTLHKIGYIRTTPQFSSQQFRRHLQHKLSASATIDNTPSSSSSSYEMSNFAKRMKNLISKDKRASKSKANNKAPKNLIRIETLEDFKQVLGTNQDKIVVVRWYAPWCKACKAIAPLFYRLAATFPNAIFVDVPVTPENANLHQGLGVPSLPYGHIYHPTGKLVEELKISRKHFTHFAKVLKTYVDGQCDIDFDGNNQVFDPNCDATDKQRSQEALR